jgi:hypothetical protein
LPQNCKQSLQRFSSRMANPDFVTLFHAGNPGTEIENHEQVATQPACPDRSLKTQIRHNKKTHQMPYAWHGGA